VPPGKYVAWSTEPLGKKIEFNPADGELIEVKIQRE
jgi:hypothetical protein